MLSKLVVTVFLLLGTVSCFPDGRIVNGTDSKISTHPYIASLRVMGSHSCGCSIIASRWILTAAHCVDQFEIETLSIQYGLTDVSPSGPNVIPLKRIIIHEEYAPEALWRNDLALIELKGQLIFNYKTIAPVTLPEPYFEVEQLDEGVPGIVAGWGLNATGGVRMKTLQEVDQKIYSDEECQRLKGNMVKNDQLCAGVDEGDKGSCSSDSGGPLMYKGILVGVVSWGPLPCAIQANVYAKVSHYIDWIHSHINK